MQKRFEDEPVTIRFRKRKPEDKVWRAAEYCGDERIPLDVFISSALIRRKSIIWRLIIRIT